MPVRHRFLDIPIPPASDIEIAVFDDPEGNVTPIKLSLLLTLTRELRDLLEIEEAKVALFREILSLHPNILNLAESVIPKLVEDERQLQARRRLEIERLVRKKASKSGRPSE